MVFSSLLFLYAFLPLCLICVYFSRSVAAQNVTLLIFSLIFYAWGEPLFILLMLGMASFAWWMGRLIQEEGQSAVRRKRYVILTVAVILLSLGVFKYSGFFVIQINGLLNTSFPVPNLSLPIGISFYTFQILTYIIDLYRGDANMQKSWHKFLLYVSLFPQMVAGPIVRYRDIADQIEHRKLKTVTIAAGINRFVIGLAKKVLIANQLGLVVSQVMEVERLASISAVEAWIGLIGFALQIYFDFSGYSDMAIGLAMMFGFELKENFRYPYIARSVTDFWRRWHISLSFFFRDYVYIPLGGNRRYQYRNMLIVWALTGFWHGASWNFMLWGLYFFVFLALEKRFWRERMEQAPRWISGAYMAAILLGGWILFYYTDLSAAGVFSQRLFAIGTVFINEQARTLLFNNLLLYLIAFVAMTPVMHTIRLAVKRKWDLDIPRYQQLTHTATDGEIVTSAVMPLDTLATVLMVAAHLIILFLATASLAATSFNPFLYFRF